MSESARYFPMTHYNEALKGLCDSYRKQRLSEMDRELRHTVENFEADVGSTSALYFPSLLPISEEHLNGYRRGLASKVIQMAKELDSYQRSLKLLTNMEVSQLAEAIQNDKERQMKRDREWEQAVEDIDSSTDDEEQDPYEGYHENCVWPAQFQDDEEGCKPPERKRQKKGRGCRWSLSEEKQLREWVKKQHQLRDSRQDPRWKQAVPGRSGRSSYGKAKRLGFI